MPDLEDYAKQELGDSYKGLSDDDGSGDLESLLKIASQVKSLLDKLRLKVLCLQPFSQFEGYTDEQKRKGKFAKAKVWMDVMEAVGSDMLQVGSTDDKSSTSDRSIVVKDLQELADMAATRSMRIGYEVSIRRVPLRSTKSAYYTQMWCWAAYNDTWRDIWDICKAGKYALWV